MAEHQTLTISEKQYTVEQLWQPLWQNMTTHFTYTVKPKDSPSHALKLSIGITEEAQEQMQLSGEELPVFANKVLPGVIKAALKEGAAKYSITFHRDDNVHRLGGVHYFKVGPSAKATATNFLYGNDTMTNNDIRREILTIAYDNWQNDPHGHITGEQFINAIPADPNEIERNFDYLVKKHYLEGTLPSGGGYHLIKISPSGIDLYENPTQFNREFALKIEQHTTNIGGDYIAPTIIGDNNSVNIKSQITEAFNSVRSELSEEQLAVAQPLLETLEQELSASKPDNGKVKEAWEKVKTLGGAINSKLLSHPIIAQVIAQVLLNHEHIK